MGLGDARRVKPSGPPGASGSSVSIALRSAPAQNVLPLINEKKASQQVRDTLNAISKKLDTKALLDLNQKLASPDKPEALPRIVVEEPTIKVRFVVSTSPFAGKVGKWVTSRHVRERLEREARRNLALVRRLTPLIVLGSFALTVAVMVPGVGVTVNGATRWLGAGPLTTFLKVQMPLILPGVISGALFAFITSFDEVVDRLAGAVLDDLLGDAARHFLVPVELHRVVGAALR